MASDSPRTVNGSLVFLGSFAAFWVVAFAAIGLLALNRPKVDEIEAKRAGQRIATREKLDAETLAKMQTVGWADKAKGIVHLPVSEVAPLIVTELKAKKPAPCWMVLLSKWASF